MVIWEIGGKIMNQDKIINEIIPHFLCEGKLLKIIPFGNGHINDTYRLYYQLEDGQTQSMILQRMNTYVFQSPDKLMENVLNVTSFLKNKTIQNGREPERETLTVILTDQDLPYYQDHDNHVWRMYPFIENTMSYDLVEDENIFYQSALAFGKFQNLLADYPADTLYETIPDFHDTRKRYDAFIKAMQEDCMQRAQGVSKEIAFVIEHEHYVDRFNEALQKGEVPLRVTHNDTKLNNILFDCDQHQAVCIVDLDTVMPGLVMNDFGDAIRFGASTALEDEKDLSQVACDMHLFEVYTKGFIEGTQGKLTPQEVELLPLGALMMTLECGIRFLTDYLQGDVYFKTEYPEHNLVRCRTQFQLVSDMEKKWNQMTTIVHQYAYVHQ